MSWENLASGAGTFIWGFAMGYFWFPVFRILKRIWREAKLAQQQWKNPHG